MVNITTLTGLTIGQYTLKEQLGAGGMGVVYRGYQPALEREVAVKVLSPTLVDQEGYIERFTREARTAAALEHAHIVPIYDYGTQQDVSFVVMRLLTGGTLAQRMSQRGKDDKPLPSPGEVSTMLKEIASALDYAHSRHVIHRDIKAGNIMFDAHGSAYLVDFGIAKLKDSLGVTQSGLAVGTPTHMSPEQWRGEEVVPATDQYALGVVIFEAISGHLPFESNTAYALMNKHLNEPPTPLRSVRPDLPVAVDAVLQEAMAKNPADRFPSVTAFAEAFENAIHEKQGQPTGFFTFEVTPIRPRADGELPSMYVSNRQTITPTSADVSKPKNDAMSPLTPQEIKEVRRAVEKRLAKRKEVLMHVVSYVGVNGGLWAIWALTSRSWPWPIIVSLGWGFGLVMHLIEAWYDMGFGDRMRDREYQRELARRGVDTQVDLGDMFYAEKAKRDPKARLSASVENIATIVEREIEKKAAAVRAEQGIDDDDDEELDRREMKRRRRERRKYGEW